MTRWEDERLKPATGIARALAYSILAWGIILTILAIALRG